MKLPDKTMIRFFKVRNWIFNKIRGVHCWIFHQPDYRVCFYSSLDTFAQCRCQKCGHEYTIPIQQVRYLRKKRK